MPIYEYEPVDRNCLMCEGRVEILQNLGDPPLTICPYCGLEIRRVVSRASIQVAKAIDPEAAAKRGFSTFRRSGKGTWEKVAGPDSAPATQETPPPGGVLRLGQVEGEDPEP